MEAWRDLWFHNQRLSRPPSWAETHYFGSGYESKRVPVPRTTTPPPKTTFFWQPDLHGHHCRAQLLV